MKNKYYNDAIIGGKNITASYSKNGELLRLIYPSPDYMQFIDYFETGVKINDSGIIYLHQDINNMYQQYYTEDTNILNTKIKNTYFNLKITQTDFVLLKNSVLVKKYTFENKNSIELNVNFLIHSKLLSDYNNMVGAVVKDNTLIQYTHNTAFCITSNKEMLSYQLNDTKNNINSGEIADKDYIGMSPDSSISYNIGLLKPNEIKELVVYISIIENKNEIDLQEQIKAIKKIDAQKEEVTVKKYWRKYVKDHDTLQMPEEDTEFNRKLNKVYKRTILLFPLLTNQEVGGISAAIEVDENITKCGKYAYCWPRDAVFVTRALDILNMTKETEKFYKVFCKNTQSENGMWEQRFYTDGKLAPCWGYQIDETASVIYGVNEHYKKTKEIKFLKDTLKMCEKATRFLFIYMDNILGTRDESDVVKNEIEETYHTKEREKLPISYDIWEMNEGVHLYSLAAIYGAFNSMLEIYENIKEEYTNNRLKLENIHKNEINIRKYMEELKKYISKNLYDEKTKTLLRNLNDQKTDISILGAVEPFKLFSADEKKINNTIEKINLTLRTYTGGYLRFEQDHYMEGQNPWPIATLWMAMYYNQKGEKEKAEECIKFVVNSCNEHGLLAEQVDNKTMTSNWVIGLGWSHAMFVLSQKEISQK